MASTNLSLSHDRRGSGEPLCLIHGIGSHWNVWEPVLDTLAAEREVIAVDLPGFGDSPELAVAPTVPNLAEAVRDFMASLGHDTFHVAGNSLGGGIALELGRMGVARSVCANSPIRFWSPAEVTYARGVLTFARALARSIQPFVDGATATAPRRTALAGLFFGRPWKMPADYAALAFRNLASAPGWEATKREVITGRFTAAQLRSIPDSVPVTIAWGAMDALLFPWQARRAAAAMPRANVVMLRGCGHVPTFDDPDLVARSVLDASRPALGRGATRPAASPAPAAA